MIFDTHAHYDDKQFDQDREELLVSQTANSYPAGTTNENAKED